VSLKTLYNRLNAYRAQGLSMDYDPRDYDSAEQRRSGEELSGRSRGLEGNISETQ